MPESRNGVRRRDSVFFVADVNAAADTAAFSLEDHGLTPEQVESLSYRIVDKILDWFEEEIWNA